MAEIPNSKDLSSFVLDLMRREREHLQELMECQIQSLRAEVTVKFEANDKALEKVEEFPTDLDKAVERLRELFDERFQSIDIRFRERDKYSDVRAQGNKELLEEQRQASERAIGKAEKAVKDQLDAQFTQVRDLKERIDREEGRDSGSNRTMDNSIKMWGVVIAALMILLGLLDIAATIMLSVKAVPQ